MTVAVVEHVGPWSEQEYFALGHTPTKIELIDGSLLVSPRSSKRHQHLATGLLMALYPPARRAGLLALPEINLRLGNDRILEPDLVVADTDDRGQSVHADEVRLVVEIVSPSNAGTDRLLKPQLYAAAGIQRYLRVEQPAGSVQLHLHLLADSHYRPALVVDPGEKLHLVMPGAADVAFETELDPGSWLEVSS